MNATFGRRAGRYPYMMHGNGMLAMTPEKIAGLTVAGLVVLGGAYVVTRRRRRRRKRRS